MEEVVGLISNFGFPIVAFLLMYNMATKAIKENTKAINELKEAINRRGL